MLAFVNINSKKNGEINRFLCNYYGANLSLKHNTWEKKFHNPIEIAELIGVYIDNIENYDLSFWLSLDSGIIIKVDDSNANEIIKYLYERFPY